jgi:alanyl-tRNA synthetase
LSATVLEDDEESYAHWRTLGVPAERIFRMGEKTNFWAMGPTGPCGPNSELIYDLGPEACTCGRSDCSVALDNDCERWLETWNLVFMQYDQAADGTRTPLPKPGVDTGMGLERIAAVVQQAPSVYETDLFAPILDRVQSLLGHTDAQRGEAIVPYRVIADHGRAATFLIADGITPGNEGRAYVLRMIMRRAIRFGRRAGFDRAFLGQIAAEVVDQMGADFPDLQRRRAFILKVIEAEEERFSQTLSVGLDRLAEVVGAVRARSQTMLPGDEVFKLYDTYGFPVEMTRDVAAESGLTIDEEGFRHEMDAQRRRSRAGAGQAQTASAEALADLPATTFVGYTKEATSSTIQALLKDGVPVEDAVPGDAVTVVLDRTPFYAEAGGQVGDTGALRARGVRIDVTDTRRVTAGITGHLGRVVEGRARVGLRVRAVIDGARRAAVRRNHTATHLLHRALQEVLGDHARQAGSLVAPDRLRFDFTHLSPLSQQERDAVERRVNELILDACPVRSAVMALEQAQRLGAMALFGEKYGEQVRVITVDGYSRELCGGTHLTSTGQIGLFTIAAESSVAAGVRRIEAVTGWQAYARARGQDQLVAELAGLLRATPGEVEDRVRRLLERVRELERSGPARGGPGAEDLADGLRASVDVNGVPVATHETLRAAGDVLRERLGGGVVVLGGVSGDRVNLVVMVSTDLHGRGLRADALLRAVAARLGGTGGGKADLAQGSGRETARLDEALAAVPDDVRQLVEAP